MYLKNLTAALITINAPHTVLREDPENEKKVTDVVPGEAYDLMPAGPAVEVPDEVAKCNYVRNLHKAGEIEVSKESAPVDDPFSDDNNGEPEHLREMDDDALVDYAKAIGLKPAQNWNRDKLVAAIVKKEG